MVGLERTTARRVIIDYGQFFAWYVNGTYAANTSNYTADLSNGTVLSVRVTPFDGLYFGEAVEAELQIVTTNEP